ncbi:CRISPR-associated endonuclease Cas2 [Pelagicoccus sp. SDUM812003]|uniref:CRISPR-associated endonuclease Cas2 n=1 Tax=Pelagicoccus sp. SDUM812003 TaxID=3041267 RepID=UPI00280D9807|nr:CRISPR-associated endonuclease Cas2 [Pelagicoccus sp. SDUM812003]MDQ8201750.1 CRISPR-associated endonuclease Cas2 [Pelagicoccus sp. SDUM812003]
MLVIVTYDVSTVDPKPGARRLRRVAKICESYGIRVQKSVFECQVGNKELAEMKIKLADVIDKNKDSLRFYLIDQAMKARIEHIGTNLPIDVSEDTLMI